MSLEAIAAMLGHRSMDMTLRYTKIANRTVADGTSPSLTRSTPSTRTPSQSPRTRSDPRWPDFAASTTDCWATATAPDHPSSTAPSSRSAKPARSSRPASSSDPPIQAQHDDATTKGQPYRAELFDQLLTGLTKDEAS
jgi:hypothetical protein